VVTLLGEQDKKIIAMLRKKAVVFIYTWKFWQR
jgi:hypothetical protein